MLARLLRPLSAGLLLGVLTVALSATGFAHRLPSAQDDALAFALANGADAADFCGDLPGENGVATPSCLACQITSGADLPPPCGQLVRLHLARSAPVAPPPDILVLRSGRDPAHFPQGPPRA